jgi:hypothetical protein
MPSAPNISLVLSNTIAPKTADKKNTHLLNKNLYQTKPDFLNLNSIVPTADTTAAQKGFKTTNAVIKTGKFIEVITVDIELKSILIFLNINKEEVKKINSKILKSNKYSFAKTKKVIMVDVNMIVKYIFRVFFKPQTSFNNKLW